MKTHLNGLLPSWGLAQTYFRFSVPMYLIRTFELSGMSFQTVTSRKSGEGEVSVTALLNLVAERTTGQAGTYET
jgi:hypothetical protein